MIELGVTAVLLLSILVLAARKGHRHLVSPAFPWLLTGVCALAAYLLESLPFTAYAASPSTFTLIALLCGVMAGRVVSRGLIGWGQAWARDEAAGHAVPPDVRLIHPFIAAGIWLSAVPLLYAVVAKRHETLETLATPRDPHTMIVAGSEPVALEGGAQTSDAVLLLHGWTGSPADFGDLPETLRARGLAVRAPLLPGHGRFPWDLAACTTEAAERVVAEARAELESKHGRVSIVGFSYGAVLALRTAAVKAPHRLILVNPYLGETATPSWSPVDSDSLLTLTANVFTRTFRPTSITRVNDPAGLVRQRAYHTVLLAPTRDARDAARRTASEAALSPPACPLTVLLSAGDETAPTEAALAWCMNLRGDPGHDVPPKCIEVSFARSNHLLFLDYDREAAAQAVLDALK